MFSFRSRDCIIYALIMAASMGLVFTFSELKQQQTSSQTNIGLITTDKPEASAIRISAKKSPLPPSREYMNLLSELRAYFVNRPEPWFQSCLADQNTQHFIRFFFNWNQPETTTTTTTTTVAPSSDMPEVKQAGNLQEDRQTRRKRSISSGKENLQQEVVGEKTSDILYKYSKDLGVKKTSFSSFNNNNYDKKYKLKRPKNRYFYSSPNLIEPIVAELTTTQAPRLTPPANGTISGGTIVNETRYKQLDRIVDVILLDRIKVNIKINIAMKVVNQVAETIGTNVEVLRKQIKHTSSPPPTEVETSEQLAKWSAWIPEVNITAKNQTDLTMFDEIDLLNHLDENLQRFSMAMEQLNYDKPLYKNYKKLDRISLKVLCDLDALVDLFKTLVRNQTQLVTMLDSAKMIDLSIKTSDNSSANSLKLVEASYRELFSNPRTFYAKQIIKSALDQAFSKVNLSQVATRRLMNRVIMPEEERCVPDQIERSYRDLSILLKFSHYIGQHKFALLEILRRNTIEDRKK